MKKIDLRFVALYIFLLLFPHYLARDLNSVLFLTLVYILAIFLFKRFTDFSTFEILFYLLIAISFSGLHLLYNHEYSPASLAQNMDRTVQGPWRYRILIPELMNLMKWIFKVEEVALRAGFRFFSLSMAFLSTFLLLTKTLNIKRGVAYFLPLLYVFMIPFSWDLLYVTDFPEIFFSGVLLLAILLGRKWMITLFFVLGMLNRDSIVIFGLLFYFFYIIQPTPFSLRSAKEQFFKQKREFVFMGALFLILCVYKVLAMLLYGESNWTEYHLVENLPPFKAYWEYLLSFSTWEMGDFSRLPRLLSFAGGIYIFLFIFYKSIDTRFLTSLLGASIIFLVPLLEYANINETRVLFFLLPYFVYGIGCILSVKDKESKSKENNFGRLLYILFISGLVLLLLFIVGKVGSYCEEVRIPAVYSFDFEEGQYQGFHKEILAESAKADLVTDEVYTGKYSLRVASEYPFGKGEVRINLPVKSSTEYLLEGFFKTENLDFRILNQTKGAFYILEFEYRKYLSNDDNGDFIVAHPHLGELIGNNDWKKVSYRFKTHFGTKMIRIGIGLNGSAGAPAVIYADSLCLRELR